MMVEHPLDDKLSYFAHLYFLHHIAVDVDVFGVVAVVVLQRMKAIQ